MKAFLRREQPLWWSIAYLFLISLIYYWIGAAQYLSLPINSFRWASKKEIECLFLFYQKNYSTEALVELGILKKTEGFFIQCDLYYPKEVFYYTYIQNFPKMPYFSSMMNILICL